jgi:hypothetical protein
MKLVIANFLLATIFPSSPSHAFTSTNVMRHNAMMHTSIFATVDDEVVTTMADASAGSLIDKSMEGIDAPGSFDPTDGESPALARNNLGEVWNQQVSFIA